MAAGRAPCLRCLFSISLLLTQVDVLTGKGASDSYDKDFCVKRLDGDYADPQDCRAFYQCTNQRTVHRPGDPATPNIMFDPVAKQLQFGSLVNCLITKVFREVYMEIPGTQVDSLENNLKYPCSPSVTSFLDTFCTYHLSAGTRYGQRLRSFFLAPETGDYLFQSSCDDSCKVFLSTDNRPENKRMIINQTERSPLMSWQSEDQTSKPVPLIANKVYYLEALHKDSAITNDFMCIAVKYPSKKIERPISARHLVLDGQGVKRLGCDGSVESGIKDCTECTRENTVQGLEKHLSRMKQVIESSPSREEYHNATKEVAMAVDSLLSHMTTSTTGMRIAWLLEDFAQSAADHWNEPIGEVAITLPRLIMSLRGLEERFRFPNNGDSGRGKSWGGVTDFIEIKATNYNHTSNVFSVLYGSLDKFIPRVGGISNNFNSTSSRFKVNSRIICSLLSRVTRTSHVKVTVQLAHLKVYDNMTVASPVCVWWDYSARDGASDGQWSTEGCVKEYSNRTHTTCRCSHLTNFAILMQLNPVQIDEEDARALEIITYIGCGLSILGISVTVLILGCLSGLRSERNLIHLNLSLTVGILQVIFLAGVKATENKVTCTTVAILLHYFCLTSFAWMLVEGAYLYVMVIKVFNSDKERFKYYLAAAYGFPAVVVMISAASARLEGYGTDVSCWLSHEKGLIYAFVAPALGIALINTVVLILVIREILKIQANSYVDNSKLVLIRSGVKSTIILLPLLGVTWVFGVLTLSQDMLVFQYLFAICNSLQGFFLFIFHCLLNSEVRKAVKRRKEIWYSRKATSAPSTSLFPSTWRKVQTNVSVDALDTLAVPDDRRVNTNSSKLQSSMENLNIKPKGSPKTNRVRAYGDAKVSKEELSPIKGSPAWEHKTAALGDTRSTTPGPANRLPPLKKDPAKEKKKNTQRI